MATQIQGVQILLANYGPTVTRAAATLPQNATGSIFNVIGGRVLVTTLVGQVGTALASAGFTLAITVNNTAFGAATVVGAASGSITASASGAQIGFASLGGQVTLGAWAAGNPRFVATTGQIQVTTSAANTGTVSWTCTYISLDRGAYVTAA